jgi:hypothetical protein
MDHDISLELEDITIGGLDFNVQVSLEHTVNLANSITIDADLSGNDAELMLDIDAYGDNTSVEVWSQVYTVENLLSSISVYARSVTADRDESEFSVTFADPPDSNSASNRHVFPR